MALERLLILAATVLALTLLWLAWKTLQSRRLARLARSEPPSPLGALVEDGPALLYFTTDDCAQCRFQQTPVINRVAAESAIPVFTLDAMTRQDLTRHFGILTVPSTVVLDRGRRPVAINHGFAPLPRLQSQVQLGLAGTATAGD